MSRSQPTLICSHQENNLVYEVCEADAVYAVLYQGRAIKLRKHNPAVHYLGYKYGKTTFPEAGHAIRLARKLNEVHNTQDFTVAQMTVEQTRILVF
jgi:hypothetical protein